MKLIPIVEGPGDASAVPHLLRGILYANKIFDVEIDRPYKAGEFFKVRKVFPNLIRALEKEGALLLVLIDCDDGCAVTKASELRDLIPEDLAHVRLEIAFIVREYESLFLFDPETTRACLQIANDIAFPDQPEELRGVKGWLSRVMGEGRAYKETVDQEQITARLDLDVIRPRSRSFRHLESALRRLREKMN